VTGRTLTVLRLPPRPVSGAPVVWDARDAAGLRLASGVYLVRLHAAGSTEQRRVLLVR
jgi:hypothetical protein